MNGTMKVLQWKGGGGHLFICQHHQAQWPTPILPFVSVGNKKQENRKDLHMNNFMWTLDGCRGEWDHQCTMVLRLQPHETYWTELTCGIQQGFIHLGITVTNVRLSCWCHSPTNIHTISFMSYRIPGNLVAIKFGKMGRNCSDKYLANLKFGNLHDQRESHDISQVLRMRTIVERERNPHI